MKRSIVPFMLGALFLTQLFAVRSGEAACAQVTMEILQQLTIERVAFDAKLTISNGIADQSLQNIRVDVNITDTSGNVKNDIFFVRTPTLSGIGGSLDGSGSVGASASGEAHWLIIPSAGAGGENSAGTEYWVGATLSYTIGDTQETVPINPAKITVRPMPQLVLDYFMPYQVLGDNPFTPQVEAPVPYPLAVRVMNDGYGTASKLKIDSAQPKIIDNRQGLLISFRIIGASVNDSAVLPSLTVDFGDLGSKRAATASWQMISTLSGHFIDFSASFTHASDLGGELTSLLKATNTHYLTHMVKVNLPGRDNRLDFLADTDNDANHLPNAIYESEIPDGGTDMAASLTPVTVVYPSAAPVRPTPAEPSVPLTLPAGASGWIYTKMDDPSQGLLTLLDVVRADGVHLGPNNFWVDQGLDANYKKTWTLQFIDYRAASTTTGAYTLVFSQPDADTTPPATAITYEGPVVAGEPAYITPQTRVILTAEDNEGGSGVDGMYKKLAGEDSEFVPAYPFSLTEAGSHSMEYYSTDLAGNVEAAKSATFVVVDHAPEITSFTVTPAVFTPQAPRGVAAARTADFSITAASGAATLPVEIAIAPGTLFQTEQTVRTIMGNATPGVPLHIAWDGRDGSGRLLAEGDYTAQVKVSDGLDNPADDTAPVHTVTATVVVKIGDWLNAGAIDPNPTADQMHPSVSGSRVVWQDMRGGSWNIYTKAVTDEDSQMISTTNSDRERPAIDGNRIVWQDSRNGNWDIYGYDLSTSSEIPICTESGEQTEPVIAGDWVVWQDKRLGNWDIRAYNLQTHENLQITDHERDQLHPAISGTTVTWEDYRHGPGEIYQYDLATRTESRSSYGPVDETYPALSGNTMVWSDRRTGQSDIFLNDAVRGALRLTYGTGDHSQAALLGDLLVYTDFEAGADDPNLSFRLLSSGAGERMENDPARQEEPAIGSNLVVWQDTRDGKYQIYSASFATEALPVEAQIRPGFNLVAIGQWLATQYPSASDLIADVGDTLGIDRLLLHNPLHDSYTEAKASGGDFTLAKGSGLVIYAEKAGTLKVGDSGETASYSLLAGANQIGILTVPYGYSAHDLMNSVGLANIQSVRRFDSGTGAWQTVAVRSQDGEDSLVGTNFVIQPGDGLVITMKNRVDGWMP